MMFLKSLKGFRAGKFKDRQEPIHPLIKKAKPKTNNKIRIIAKRVDEVIDNVIADMSLGERLTWANLDEEALLQLQLSLGSIIREQLETSSTKKNLNEFQVADLIVKELWKRLRKKYKMRALK